MYLSPPALLSESGGERQVFQHPNIVMRMVSGVTEAFQSLPVRPVEFALLGHTPSLPYTLLDVAAVSTLYSLMLNRGLTRDFVRVHLKEKLGPKWKVGLEAHTCWGFRV